MNMVLENIRGMIEIIHGVSGANNILHPVCLFLSRKLPADVMLYDTRGALVASSDTADSDLADGLASISGGQENVLLQTEECSQIYVLSYTLFSGSGVLGRLILAKRDAAFTENEITIALCARGMITLGIMTQKINEKNKAEEDLHTLKGALDTLTYSEIKAAALTLRSMNGREGCIVVGKIAAKESLTHSMIVNSMRKLQSAGLLESRSMGAKGTYIRISNPYLMTELKKYL